MIRPSTAADIPAIATIYGWNVLNGLGTFEEVPPTAAEMAQRRAGILGHGLPWLVYENAGEVVGYAYIGPFRLRAAYRYTVEDSVYIAPHAVGQGVGKALVNELITECRALGVHQVIAGIGDSGNAASVGLHRSLGFEPCGSFPAVGFKFGRWVDVLWMQLSLNGGADVLPTGAGLKF